MEEWFSGTTKDHAQMALLVRAAWFLPGLPYYLMSSLKLLAGL